MNSTKQPWDISYTDCAALARCAGLRNAGDRVRSALANGEIEGDRRGATMWTMRRHFETWLEQALEDDRCDDDNMLRIDQARAMAAARGVRSSSARVLTAVTEGEISGCFKDTSGWWIPKDTYAAWLEFVCAEGEQVDDGTISLAEATAIVASYGLRGMRSDLLVACIEGEIDGAYRDGATWRLPIESVRAWASALYDAAMESLKPPPEPTWWEQNRLWIGLAVLATFMWMWALRL